MLFIEVEPVINHGARVQLLPFGVALRVTTRTWIDSTTTLRRPTHKQLLVALARIDRFGVGRLGPRVPNDCHPVIAVLSELDPFELMPFSA